MRVFGTPTALSARMTSRSSAIEVTVAGALDGLTLMATVSPGDTNRAHASLAARSPVSDAIPSVSIVRTAGSEILRSTIAPGWKTSTTRPGNRPGMASFDGVKSGAWRAIFSESSAEGSARAARRRRGLQTNVQRAERRVIDERPAVHVSTSVRRRCSSVPGLPSAGARRSCPRRCASSRRRPR